MVMDAKPAVDDAEPLLLLEDSLNDKKKNKDDDDHDHVLLTLFRQQRHSLRLSASNIAAIAGYHPWKELPILLLDLIYQGRQGQKLLQQDSDNLSIEMIPEETALQQLAEKAGVCVKEALDVKNGKRSLHSIQEAKDLKYAILKKARLTNPTEMKELREGVRGLIDKSFGTYNEDAALDQYQRITGWPVTGRNAEVMAWDFDFQGQPGKAYPLRHRQAVGAAAAESNVSSDSNNSEETVSDTTINADEVIPVDTDTSVTSVQQEKGEWIRGVRQYKRIERPRPFFSILGSIDGIREELTTRVRPTANAEDNNDKDDDDDDSFCIRHVIVECKHRMSSIKNSPPLYDQIQAVVYMLMYKVDQADIVQVLRSENTTNREENTRDSSSTAEVSAPIRNVEQLSTTIAVHRIALEDNIHCHRFHWEQTILPRLLSFVQVVYSFRGDDHKRYMLLIAIASKMHHDAWNILFEACPWLEKAETAFRLIDSNHS